MDGLTCTATVAPDAWMRPRIAKGCIIAPMGWLLERGVRGRYGWRAIFSVQHVSTQQAFVTNGKCENPDMRILLNTASDPGLPPGEQTELSAPATNAAPPDALETTATQKTDDTTRKADSPKAGLGERIKRTARRVFNFPKGKGRPKKCRECGGEKCAACEFTGIEPGKLDGDGTDGGENADLETLDEKTDATSDLVPPAKDDSLGGEIFREACGSSVETILDLADTVTLALADKAGHDPDFSEKALARARPNQKKLDRFSKSLRGALEEQNIQVKNPCTKAAFINGLGLFSGYATLARIFIAEANRKRREGK